MAESHGRWIHYVGAASCSTICFRVRKSFQLVDVSHRYMSVEEHAGVVAGGWAVRDTNRGTMWGHAAAARANVSVGRNSGDT